MAFADLVKKVIFTCPHCKTSIEFVIPPDYTGTQRLQESLEGFKCPRCKNSLDGLANDTFNKILAYNRTANALNEICKSNDVAFD